MRRIGCLRRLNYLDHGALRAKPPVSLSTILARDGFRGIISEEYLSRKITTMFHDPVGRGRHFIFPVNLNR